MCGIAGFVGSGTRSDLSAMTAALQHRGPDGDGFYEDEANRVFLGHRRLSIIDLAGGGQPMLNDDASLVVVFNGEIYNHRTLRAELERAGRRFRTDHSDTEVILRGYEAWGEAITSRLDGMFAFAIYDASRRRLFLARDRFGEKPLFYFASPQVFAFSSELPSLRLHPLVARASVNIRAVQKFFAYSFIPGDLTAYQGVYKLPPGSTLSYDLDLGTFETRRYWRFSIVPDAPPPGDEDSWAEELADLFREAVRTRLESDVPLGVFLSGGIDSSATAKFAADVLGAGRLSTFTIGFEEKSYDEAGQAAAFADMLGARHSTETCSAEFMRAAAPGLFARLGEPFGDPSLIPTYMLARHAARHVKVALSGDGGDELFAGYDPFKALDIARRYQAVVPRPIHQALRLLAARLPPADTNMSLDFKVNRALRGVSFPARIWNPVWLAALDPDDISRVFNERVSVDDLYSEAIDVWDAAKSPSLVDRTLEFFTNIYFSDDILVKSDRAGMMNSLEIRAPFLHPGLVDFARRLPHRVKYRNGTTKWILKRALAPYLPQDLLSRRKKGFGIPVAQWLRTMDCESSRPVEGLDDSYFATWSQEHRARRRDHRGALWCRIALHHALSSSPGPTVHRSS